MNEHLIFLRISAGFLSLLLVLWSFWRFRNHLSSRYEFLLMTMSGIALLGVSVFPDLINIVAEIFALDNKQFGRLITLLILSNIVLWVFFLSKRNKDTLASIQFDFLVRHIAQERYLSEEEDIQIQEITVIIPALNEEENLKELLPRMPSAINGRPLGVLVVDDGSTDNTVSTVKKLGFSVISSPINRGGGAALRLGYDIAMLNGAKIIVTMDGDGQHMPEEIERLVEPIINDQADFIIGSRVLGDREKDSAVRWVGIHIFNLIVNVLAGTKITDCSNGFRAFRVESLNKVLLIQDQFHTTELIIDAAKKGIKIGEAPVTVLKRHSGHSKKGRNLLYGYNFSKTILKTWLR